MSYVYILQSRKVGKYYVGSTVDLKRRLAEHNKGTGGQFSSRFAPWDLMYFRETALINEARVLEKKVKAYKGGNAFKKIINGDVAEWSKAPHC